jgi:ABC-type spermidine/putrescine transport system permease subunit I
MSSSFQVDLPSAIGPTSEAEAPQRSRAWLWLLFPYALTLVAFLALPLANVLLLSVYRYSPIKIWIPEFTVANYIQMFTPYFGGVALRTASIGAIATVLCVILGYPIAYYLSRCSKRALTVGMFILTLPLMVSAVVGSFGWIVILGRNGLLNSALKALGAEARIDILYSPAAVVIALVHFLLPLMVLPLMAAIEKIPIRLEEAATNLGAGSFARFRLVILPLSRPGLVSGVVLCFSIAISVVVTSALLGGRTGRMFGNDIYEQVITAANWPFASALSIMLILAIVISMSLAIGASRRNAAGRAR